MTATRKMLACITSSISSPHPQRQSGEMELSGREEIIKIADIQRMNIDQLNLYAKKIGLKHLGSLTKSQVVFEIVKAISENPMRFYMVKGF